MKENIEEMREERKEWIKEEKKGGMIEGMIEIIGEKKEKIIHNPI